MDIASVGVHKDSFGSGAGTLLAGVFLLVAAIIVQVLFRKSVAKHTTLSALAPSASHTSSQENS